MLGCFVFRVHRICAPLVHMHSFSPLSSCIRESSNVSRSISSPASEKLPDGAPPRRRKRVIYYPTPAFATMGSGPLSCRPSAWSIGRVAMTARCEVDGACSAVHAWILRKFSLQWKRWMSMSLRHKNFGARGHLQGNTARPLLARSLGAPRAAPGDKSKGCPRWII